MAASLLVPSRVRTDLEPARFRNAATLQRVDCQDSQGGRELLCIAVLDRPLTERERFWFETAESWRDPAPGRFLMNGAHVSFLCGAEEKEKWERHLAVYLEQAWKEA